MADSKLDSQVADPQVPLEFPSTVFHFKLPRDGLALRSAGVVNGVPELRFDASLKVPTIQEEDLATAFRLVSENKRPGFFYTGFPPTHPLTHPLSANRLFMQYSPAWLRQTGVGKLLAEADWSMKCLHIGTRTNEDKSIFKSWSQTSELEGLATCLDFPKDGSGPTIMSCDHAKIMEGENEIVFPEEPKMKITDGSSSLYSKYITEIYQSVAYYDEPKFLKMQELIKLILAVEWLYKEKGVRVSEEWMMEHTSKRTEEVKGNIQRQRKMPPHEMIPQPTVVNRPSSDVRVKTREAVMYNTLQTKYGVERRYGYYDFGNAEVTMFKEDGTCCLSQKCLKVSLEYKCNSSVLPGLMKAWFYVPQVLSFEPNKMRDEILRRDLTLPFPISTDVAIDDTTNESGVEVRVTKSFHPPLLAPPETIVITATVDNYDKLFTNEDPNMPVQPFIPGVCEEIVPNVKSWEELFTELTVPVPRTWLTPFVGIGEPTACGGVTTQSFGVERVQNVPLREEVLLREEVPLREEAPVCEGVASEETHWNNGYKSRDRLLLVKANVIREQGMSHSPH